MKLLIILKLNVKQALSEVKTKVKSMSCEAILLIIRILNFLLDSVAHRQARRSERGHQSADAGEGLFAEERGVSES